MSQETELTDNDLAPGETCPDCGEDIVTWAAVQVSDTDELDEDECWVLAEEVEPTGLTTSFAGNVILIGHA